jgi:hypothetical protein
VRALSIHQPFASLIASGEKWVENRTWGTAYRGPLLIHASRRSRYLTAGQRRRYPQGCVVAIAMLVDCLPLHVLRTRPLAECVGKRTIGTILGHTHTEGPWCWILADVRKLAVPIPYDGRQGLFEIPMPDEIIRA